MVLMYDPAVERLLFPAHTRAVAMPSTLKQIFGKLFFLLGYKAFCNLFLELQTTQVVQWVEL